MTKEITREQLELILYYFLKSGGKKKYQANLVTFCNIFTKANKRIISENEKEEKE